MALEQFFAWLEKRPQEELGPTKTIGHDLFPMLASSELRAEHKRINKLAAAVPDSYLVEDTPDSKAVAQAIVPSDEPERTRLCLALIERAVAFDARLYPRAGGSASCVQFQLYRVCMSAIVALIERGVDADVILAPALRWTASQSAGHEMHLDVRLALLSVACDVYADGAIPEAMRAVLADIRSQAIDGMHPGRDSKIVAAVDSVLPRGIVDYILPGHIWSDYLTERLLAQPDGVCNHWYALLKHCQTTRSAKPSAKWKRNGVELLEAVGVEAFREMVLEVFPLVDRGDADGDRDSLLRDVNANILRGLLWLCVQAGDAEVCRAIRALAISAYRKIPGWGHRAVKAGNAAVYVLGEIGTEDAVGQLAVLKVRVKFKTAQKGIEKALTATAERLGIPRDEVEEMSVPAYGLTDVGVRREQLGDFTAELAVVGSKTELRWLKPDGKRQKSVPAAVKKDFADDLKELKGAGKDIARMIPAQAARIEQTYLQQKTWPFGLWRERYLDHPLVGTLARRLIWRFTDVEKQADAIFHDGRFVDADDAPVDWLTGSTQVALWHPLDAGVDDVPAWREWLMDREVRQPFKQAHREVYVLTDAERETRTYSNRFAAHILKQHQFNALCAARGWTNRLRLMVDDTYPPAHLILPTWGLRAEYWVEGAGDNYGVDTNDTGTFHYLVTDQVRFYRTTAAQATSHAYGGGYETYGADVAANHPLALEEIPPLVFSEVLRDVDLFVGVASVGNNPEWADGGPDGRYRDYWTSYSFGTLSATAETRKAVLEGLIPRLKIADRCSFTDRFLVVRGDVRTYRIHLGSSNILMEPNDQYLCIVPRQSVTKAGDRVFLPFEGDTTLSIILSKALLLAEDTKIKDQSITQQIKGF